MPRYLCIQRSASGECDPPSPADMEAMYERFNRWTEKFGPNIVDMGAPLASDGKVVTADNATDGPFVEAKEIIGGYMIIEADSLEQAVEVAQASPGVGPSGSSVEVREIRQP